jgi:1-acyl-sn-glycerol-3-phosphate acyltransferase
MLMTAKLADSLSDMADLVYRPVVLTIRALFASLGIRFDITGLEHLPRSGGAILSINHTSYLDFALAGLPSDRVGHRLVRFMAKDAIFAHPVGGPLMRGMKHIPVDREAGSQAFKDAVRAAKDGELIGVFPEATMSRSFEIKDIKNGAVRMAMSANVPLIPMIVFGGQRILGYGVKDFSRGKTVAMTVGEAMYPKRGDDADALTVELHERMKALLDQTIDRYPAPKPGEDAWWMPKRRGGTAPTLEEAEAIEERVRAEKAARRDSSEGGKAE